MKTVAQRRQRRFAKIRKPMNLNDPHAAIDWQDLVVFDVDGTFYDQRRLRLAMLAQLLRHSLQTRSLHTLRVLRTFRKVREALGDAAALLPAGAEPEDFMLAQYARTAQRHGLTPQAVQQLAEDWLEQRPLPSLAACRYPQLDALFDALHEQGKQVAVFSDYPAAAKLHALKFKAWPISCATDPAIGRLKPDPRGLLEVLRQSGVPARRALMIGDRFDRDAEAARRAGVRALIRSAKSHPAFATFEHYDDAVFKPLLTSGAAVLA